MLGLCAQSRMGKDTVAESIIDMIPVYKRFAFGDELKKLISTYFDVPLGEIEEYKSRKDLHPNIKVTMRKTLQLIGETMRNVSPDVWVINALKNVDTEMCIFTDVRYENEMRSILNKKGKLILIGRSKYLSTDPHPSESGLQDAIQWFLQNTNEHFIIVKNKTNIPEKFSKFSYFLRNDGTKDDLQKVIAQLCAELKKNTE